MRALITGVAGFAGAHLAADLAEAGASVVGLGRQVPPAALGERLDRFLTCDLEDARATRDAVAAAGPDRVFHLAASASVGDSWADPAGVLRNNVVSTTNVLEAVRAESPEARVLVACSGEEYGPVAAERLPVEEDEPLRPQNPYAVSKAAVDLLAGFYTDAHGLGIVRTRAFNHAGPGQSDTYVVASFARQVAEAERAGESAVTVETGNAEVRRDFTDVRDVVRAYVLALEHAEPGAYNVCSGASTRVADLLEGLAPHAALSIAQRTDPARVRAHDVMEIRGSHQILTAATGWQPQIPLDRTLADTLDFWRARLAGEVR